MADMVSQQQTSRPNEDNLEQLNSSSSYATLCQALQVNSLSSEQVSLIRNGNNVVYRLNDSSTIARVSRENSSLTQVQLEAQFLQHLRSHEVKVPEVSNLDCNPVQIGDRVVTFFVALDTLQEAPVDYLQLGKNLKKLHDASDSFKGVLPQWDYFNLLNQRLQHQSLGTKVSQEDILLLQSWSRRLEVAVQPFLKDSPLGVGPIHGDLYAGNVLTTEAAPYIGDFERICIGPREWDFIPEAVNVRRHGYSQVGFDQLQKGYGTSVIGWEGFETFARIRELRQTSYLFQHLDNPKVLAEFDKRMLLWKDRHDNSIWSSF